MKTILPLALLLVWLLTLGVAFLFGEQKGHAKPPKVVETTKTETVYVPVSSPDDLPARATEGGEELELQTNPLGLVPDDLPPPTKIEYVERPPEPVSTRRLTKTLLDNDPIRRMTALTEMLSQITPENAAAMMEAFENMPSGFERQWEKSLLLYAWAQVDGAAAAEFATAGESDGRGWGRNWNATTALTGWASTDPEAAKTWARSKTDKEDNPYLVGVIRGLAQSDLMSATDLTYELPYGRNRGQAVDALVQGWMQKGPRAVANWATNLSDQDPQLKAGIVNRVVNRLAKVDPNGSIDLAMSLPEGEHRQRAVETLADEWSEREPADAARWVDNLTDPNLKAEAMAEVVNNWARSDPEQAAAWLNQQDPASNLDKSYRAFARRYAQEDPKTAMVWANQIKNEDRRRDTLEDIAKDWMRRDPEAASAFLDK